MENKAADALSHRAPGPELAALSVPCIVDWEEIKQEIDVDEGLEQIRAALRRGESTYRLFLGRAVVVVPRAPRITLDIILHTEPTMGTP